MVRVKICGIRSAEDARLVLEAGVDALGFHVGLTGGRSPLEAADAAQLIRIVPEPVSSVVVTSISEPSRLVELAHSTGATTLQLYGETTPEQIGEVKAVLPGIEIWKVINVASEGSIENAKSYDSVAGALVLDKAQNAEVKGGSGQTLDWDIAKKIADAVSIPVYLAGGLNPDNIAEAIRAVRPYGVDVNSGVTNPDGSKNPEKVRLFIERVKSITM